MYVSATVLQTINLPIKINYDYYDGVFLYNLLEKGIVHQRNREELKQLNPCCTRITE